MFRIPNVYAHMNQIGRRITNMFYRYILIPTVQDSISLHILLNVQNTGPNLLPLQNKIEFWNMIKYAYMT